MCINYPIIGENIKRIKTDGRSFLGIDGGNINNSKVWFCGIEFGGSLKEMEEYYSSTVKYYDVKEYKIPHRVKAGIFEGSNYDRYLSAMYINLFHKDKLQNGDIIRPIVKVLKEELYNQNSKIFKLNLYPLAKKNSDWDKSIEEEFNISKEDYYAKYFNKRKQFFQELIREFNPCKIICTAIKNSESQFVEAFFDNKKKIEYTWDYVEFEIDSNKKKRFKISEYHQENTSLIIIPFLGMGNGNLNSYQDVIFMANYLKKKYILIE